MRATLSALALAGLGLWASAAAGGRDGGGLRPVQGETVAIRPIRGVVEFRTPPQRPLRPLGRARLVPVGSIVNATRGVVEVTSARDASGATQTARFYDGGFIVDQLPGDALTTLTLLGGPTRSCIPASGPGNPAPPTRRRVRHLWGSGHGRFRTRGRYSSATVRGTIWETDDSCDRTVTRVRRGTVSVLATGTIVSPGPPPAPAPPVNVHAGSSYTVTG
jgi:hypothetical protein